MDYLKAAIGGIAIGLIILFVGLGFLEIIGKGSSSQSVESSTAVTMEALKTTQRALDSVDAAQTTDNTALIVAVLGFLAMLLIACKIPDGCNSSNNDYGQPPARWLRESKTVYILADGSQFEGKMLKAPQVNYPTDMWEHEAAMRPSRKFVPGWDRTNEQMAITDEHYRQTIEDMRGWRT